MPPQVHLDPATLDCQSVVADREEIRRFNRQRYEMEHLDAIIYFDEKAHLVAGYKDVREDEFWVRGHMPGFPLLPGVIMCETAAQLCSYYCGKTNILQSDFIGFGGMENVRFRSPVYPGDRLVVIGKAMKIHRRQTVFNVQGFVGSTMVFHADVIGVPMKQSERNQTPSP
ncbi:MAG: beta-hydroxyacyl-ACP dehydratase [Gemmatales bacterium]|nr:MAG: beta-hydroxyacyl-ACP dehydratase [Gemmatales bacterium]